MDVTTIGEASPARGGQAHTATDPAYADPAQAEFVLRRPIAGKPSKQLSAVVYIDVCTTIVQAGKNPDVIAYRWPSD